MKSISSQLRGIKCGLKSVKLSIIKKCLDDIQSQLLYYKCSNKVGAPKEDNIYRLYKLMKNTYIYDLSIEEICAYIDKLISIAEFIEI